jgi:hypothetical protein
MKLFLGVFSYVYLRIYYLKSFDKDLNAFLIILP